jgi:DNA-binding transcriptional regulator YiaG
MKKPYHYTECGLDNIYLNNGYTLEKDGSLFVQDIHGLHRCIGERLVFQGRKLKGKEVRFARHYMDLSQKSFGELLGVDYQTVLRWESSKNVITKTADRLLKVIFNDYLNPESRLRSVIETISDLDNDRHDRKIEFSHTREWKQAA